MWTGLDGVIDLCDQNLLLPCVLEVGLEGSDLRKTEVFLMFFILPHVARGQVVALVTKPGQCFLFSDYALWASACV